MDTSTNALHHLFANGDGAQNFTHQSADSSLTYLLSHNETTPVVIPYAQRLETYIVPIVFFLIFVVGVFGNGTLVLIFVRHRAIRNVPNTYILNLALGDLLVIVSCVPFTSTVYTFETWPYGLLICKISESAKDISIGVSVFTLTALSADRFFAIVNPLRKLHSSLGGRQASKFTIGVTVCIWLLSTLLAVPAALFSYLRAFQQDNITLFEVCYPYPEEWYPEYARIAVITRFFVYYSIPLAIITFFYVMMARHLILSTRNLPGGAQSHLRQMKARRKVAKTVLAFVIIFAICFLPQHAFLLWFYNHPNAQEEYNDYWHLLRIVGFCLSFLNSCVNPIALYFVSGTFRKYFDAYLYLCCSRRFRQKYGSRAECRDLCAGSQAYRGSVHGGCSSVNGTGELRGDRKFWSSTAHSHQAGRQAGIMQKTRDHTLTTEFTAVTTLLNDIDSTKTQLI